MAYGIKLLLELVVTSKSALQVKLRTPKDLAEGKGHLELRENPLVSSVIKNVRFEQRADILIL